MGGQISLVASLVLAFLLLLPSQGWAQEGGIPSFGESDTEIDPESGLAYEQNEYGITITGIGNFHGDNLKIPAAINGYNVRAIADKAFMNGYFSKVTFSENAELVTIGNSAFMDCPYLTEINIPSSVCQIYRFAFDRCPKLTKVTFQASFPLCILGDEGYSPFSENLPEGFTIYVPAEGIDDYKNTWSKYASYIKAIGSDPTEVDGLKVELDEDAHTATITGVADGSSAKDYLYIPSTVSYNNLKYTVTAIAADAFKGNSFSSITIPSSVTSIGENAFAESKGHAYEGYPAELYVYLNYSEDDLTKYATDAFSSFAGDLLAIIVPSSNGEAYKTHFSDIAGYIYITRTDGNISDDNIFDKGYFTEGGLTYTRQLTEAEQQRGYVTCSLPFGIYPKDESYKDMFEAIYVVDNTIVKKSDGRYYLDPKDKMTSVGDYNPVYLPMLLKLKPGVSEIKFKNSSPRLITGDKYEEFPTALTVKDEQGNTLTDYTMQLCGSLEKKTDCSDIYSFNPDGTFGKHKFDTLNPFRMYLKVTSNNNISANSPVFYSSINPNGGTTGINAVHTDAAQKSALIYSIDGKLVSSNGSTAGLAKGVYIQNGKKVVVK